MRLVGGSSPSATRLEALEDCRHSISASKILYNPLYHWKSVYNHRCNFAESSSRPTLATIPTPWPLLEYVTLAVADLRYL